MWHVAHIETYSSTRKTENRFSVVMLTPDGAMIAHSKLRQVGGQRLMYLCISSEDFALAWPEPDECLPSVGAEAPPLEGWEVERIQEFVGDSVESLYDFPPETLALKERLRQCERVLVCWCVAIRVEPEQTAA